jgi:hypothetical protein
MPQPFADQFRSIPMSSNLGESLDRARGFARDQGHRAITLEHLLLAFTEDPDAAAVLQASGVDIVRLGTDVSGYLGRLLEDMRAQTGMEPQVDPELMRVLHAAVQAAQQSRRRQIDGAIVLAAVVGDGKSPAAGLLKAHGLTFEEAIRALQKANAKANAQARSRQFATPGPAQPPQGDQSQSEQANPQETVEPARPAASLEPLNVRVPQETGQSVDEILAAARARIQQRTAAMTGKSAEPPTAPSVAEVSESAPPPDGEPADDPSGPTPAKPEEAGLRDRVEPAPTPASAGPPAPPVASPRTGPAWTPTAAGAHDQRPARSPLPTQQRQQHPFPQRPLQPGEGPPRPPLPHRGVPAGLAPQPGLPTRRARAPWPDADEHVPHPRSPAANGALADAPAPVTRFPAQRTGGQGGPGPLVGSIPRRMRVGVASTAQVRISRDRIDGLILLLMKGRGTQHRPEAVLTRALSVRLRAPDGGFWIEAASPETQWAEAAHGSPQDEHMTWRWTVTPQRRGRGRLVLVVAARTLGRDGLGSDVAPPDRTIEVTVTGGRLWVFARWGGFLAVLVAAAALGRFGGEFWALSVAILKKIAGV